MTLLAVFTTLPNAESARELAQMLVARHLVACAQLEAIESVYIWEGAVQHEPEYRLMLKTTADRYPAVESAIREQHPYELPAIYALPTAQAFEPYENWVREQCQGR